MPSAPPSPVAFAVCHSPAIVEAGSPVYAARMAFSWERALAVAKKKEDNGRVGSHHFLTCVAEEGDANADYLCVPSLLVRGWNLSIAFSILCWRILM